MMRKPKLIDEGLIDPVAIDTSNRKRPSSEAAVQSIIASYTSLGIIQHPIAVRRVKHQGGKLRLIAGLHRLEACARLGIMVPAKTWDCTDDWAEMLELDDNLAGAELSALDTAIFLADRKRLYEKLHPETKRGVAGGLARQDLASDMMSFADVTAEKFGLSKRHVQRMVAAGTSLNGEAIRLLRDAPKAVSLTDLQSLAKIGDDSERVEVCSSLSRGDAKSIADAMRAFAVAKGHAAPVQDPVEQAFKDLSKRWLAAPKAAKERFIEEHGDAVYDVWLSVHGGDE